MKALIAVLTFLLIASAARADGLPIPVEQKRSSITSEFDARTYASATRDGMTTVRVREDVRGPVVDSVSLPGRYSIPQVASDGTASGLSGDGRTLVLINPRQGLRPRRETSFAVVSTDPLRVRRTIRLRGDFSFDALSPDGRSLFLINYISRRDFRKYRVRVYDLRRSRLAPKPIVDPREPPGEMNGLPLARVVSPGGRWHYTLYDGHEHPFIHALDTRDRKAVCIDLDLAHGTDAFRLTLGISPNGSALFVGDGLRRIAVVDTHTFDVAPVAAASDPGETVAAAGQDESSESWLLAALGGVAIMLGSVAWRVLRRARVRRRREAELERLRAELDDLDEPAPLSADRP